MVGLGYVGLPLAVEKAKAGFKTIGFDVQKAKVDMVNAGHNYIGDGVGDDLKKIVDDGMLRATTDFGFVKDVDFIAICVPTPLDAHQQRARLSSITCGQEAKNRPNAIRIKKPTTLVIRICNAYRHQSD